MRAVCLYLLKEIHLEVAGNTKYFFFLIQDELYIAVWSDVFVLGFIMMFSSEKAVIRQSFSSFTPPHTDRIEILWPFC